MLFFDLMYSLIFDSKGILHRRCLWGPGICVCQSWKQPHQLIYLGGRRAEVLPVPGELALLQPRRGWQWHPGEVRHARVHCGFPRWTPLTSSGGFSNSCTFRLTGVFWETSLLAYVLGADSLTGLGCGWGVTTLKRSLGDFYVITKLSTDV